MSEEVQTRSESEETDASQRKPSIAPFILDDPHFALVLPWPLTDPEVFTRHVFNQPDDEAIQNLLESIKRDTQVQKRGREVFTYDDDKAYGDHFLQFVEQSFMRKVGSESEVELTKEQIGRLTVEHRAEATRRRYESETRIQRGEGFDILFEGSGDDEVIATQYIGDISNPAFKIEMVWGRPGGERRLRYRNGHFED
jgi:hypothetical protein